MNILIATRQIFIDLEKYLLPLPEQVKVFIDQETYDYYKLITVVEAPTVLDPGRLDIAVGKTLYWDGESWTIVNTGEQSVALIRSDGQYTDLPNKAFEALVRDGKIIGSLQASEASTLSEAEALWRRASKQDHEVAHYCATIR